MRDLSSGTNQGKLRTISHSSAQLRTTNENGNFVCPDSSQTTSLLLLGRPLTCNIKAGRQEDFQVVRKVSVINQRRQFQHMFLLMLVLLSVESSGHCVISAGAAINLE
jgi:hypothetical protein